LNTYQTKVETTMKKICFFFTAFLPWVPTVVAQSLAIDVVAAGGESFAVANGPTLTWTLGEPVVETLVNQATLSQGFHQVFEFATPVFDAPNADVAARVFPNPATNWLTIETDATVPLQAQFSNLYGQHLLKCDLTENTKTIQLNSLPAGTYLLRIMNAEGRLLQAFKVQVLR
jgi:hypothetical protein